MNSFVYLCNNTYYRITHKSNATLRQNKKYAKKRRQDLTALF